MIGQTLSHYRITAALGAGGMGEVYRATDTTLNREVAIKVLPPEVVQDAERLARFRREAQVLASLNHPNIAAIYGLEEADGKPFLALELVEGEDLKERLVRGATPVDEALEIAKQIAEGLEEAPLATEAVGGGAACGATRARDDGPGGLVRNAHAQRKQDGVREEAGHLDRVASPPVEPLHAMG